MSKTAPNFDFEVKFEVNDRPETRANGIIIPFGKSVSFRVNETYYSTSPAYAFLQVRVFENQEKGPIKIHETYMVSLTKQEAKLVFAQKNNASVNMLEQFPTTIPLNSDKKPVRFTIGKQRAGNPGELEDFFRKTFSNGKGKKWKHYYVYIKPDANRNELVCMGQITTRIVQEDGPENKQVIRLIMKANLFLTKDQRKLAEKRSQSIQQRQEQIRNTILGNKSNNKKKPPAKKTTPPAKKTQPPPAKNPAITPPAKNNQSEVSVFPHTLSF